MQNYSVSIVLTIHNKQDMIEKVFNSIIENKSEITKQIIVVFDGCSDNSEKIIDSICSKEQITIEKIHTPDIFELQANNTGLKQSNCDYSILIQDDVVITEKEFDKRLIKPFIKFDDIFAVSARNAHNIYYNGINMGYKDITGPECNSDRNTFHIRSVINRGPLAFDNKIVKQLNYFNEEFSPNAYDDMDICFRAYKLLNKKCGSYRIGFESRPEWGTGRQKNQNLHAWSHRKNAIILFLNHREIIENLTIIEDRILL